MLRIQRNDTDPLPQAGASDVTEPTTLVLDQCRSSPALEEFAAGFCLHFGDFQSLSKEIRKDCKTDSNVARVLRPLSITDDR